MAWERIQEGPIDGLIKRLLQVVALFVPSNKVRVAIHRLRGVTLGKDVFIMQGTIIETAQPKFIRIGNGVQIGINCVIMGHFHGQGKSGSIPKKYNVEIDDDVFIGHGVIILPGVKIGKGAVITAGTVVSRSIPPLTMVQGNPAKAVAKCGVPLSRSTPYEEFVKNLKSIRSYS